jgi:hypothetical protein
MLKAVIDTSVFVSGLIKSPACRKILKALEHSKFILVISPETLAELIEVIARPKFHNIIKKDTVAKLIEAVKTQAILVKPPSRLEVIKVDPDDNRFLEAAVTARANCIVSLDNHLLALGKFRGILIISPEEFLTFLKKP